MSQLDRREVLDTVRTHLVAHFQCTPDEASVTFLGMDPMRVLRFRDQEEPEVTHYVSLGCSADPMGDPNQLLVSDSGPRVELAISVFGGVDGLTKSLAVLAASPAVEGLVLAEDALIDFGASMWTGSAFSAVVLGPPSIDDCLLVGEPLAGESERVRFLTATPITATEAAWVRVRGRAELVSAWKESGVDARDPSRPAVQPR